MSFYVNGDDGYKWLTCDDCEEPLMEIEAGTAFSQLEEVVKIHADEECWKKAPTPETENR